MELRDLTEAQTRSKIIDPQLVKFGWKEDYIKKEVSSVKSNFKANSFVYIDKKNIEQDVDKFIDYVLLSDNNQVLAIIEAKRYSKDPNIGRVQARTYAEDIEKQIGHKIPIFLTNGEIWKYIDEDGIERNISGPFSKQDLQRRHRLYVERKDITKQEINTNIVDRLKLQYNLKVLAEYFQKGNRIALIQMATGTGKTRLAMALIDLLNNSRKIQNILFVVDRITLANQAKDALSSFPEPVVDIRAEGFKTTGRFYVSTVQTLMGKESGKFAFEAFSPGFFDLIIFDEAHRSIYDSGNLLFKYFDAIKVGLTATPRDCDAESRNTYTLFECINNEPTVEYTYDEAVRDEVLVPYNGQVYETDVLSLGIEGKELAPELQDELRKQEEDPEFFVSEGSKFDRVFMDDKTNELIVNTFLQKCYRSDDGLPCKTIFFCASQRHAKRMKEMFGRIAPKLSNDVQVIISEEYRSEDEIKRFRKNSNPRIALSVGILDTGVDLPEICNLVFIKPVYSKIRFWQMIGRGTRNESSCKHPEWLPNSHKSDFLIMDFAIGRHSNILYHQLNTSKDKVNSRSVPMEIFKNRVKLLKEKLTEDEKKIIYNKIKDDLNKLNEDSYIIREKLSLFKEVKNSFDLDKYISRLENEISEYMRLTHSESAEVSSFILETEHLFKYILKKDIANIEKIRCFVIERLKNIRLRELNVIISKRDQIDKVLQEAYWEDLTFDKVEFIIKELSPLIKYYEKDRKNPLQINKPDILLSSKNIKYLVKEDEKLKKFIEGSYLIQKIKEGKGLTSEELLTLENEFIQLNPIYTIENIQIGLGKDFILFIKEIINFPIKSNENPEDKIKMEFDKYIIKNINDFKFNSKQIEFLTLLRNTFARNKILDIIDFAKDPLQAEHPLDLFNMEDLQKIVYKCKTIKVM